MTQLGSKKSRKGCTHCKRRRVKCDENAPCANCMRRGEQCSLLAPSPTSEHGERSWSIDTEDWLQDLELMHHYSNNVAKAHHGRGERVLHLWSEHIPAEAVKHPFLMHGLLALSALHVAFLRPSESTKYLQLSDKHQATGLAQYQTVLRQIDKDVANALFGLAATISVHSLARSCFKATHMPEPKHVSIEDVAELFMLTRGVKEVTAAVVHYIVQGPFSAILVGHRMPEGTRVTLPEPLIQRFRELHRMLKERCSDSEEYEACNEALVRLEDIYDNILYFEAKHELEDGRIWRWSAEVSLDYIKLIQAGHGPALIILAYFCVATLMMPMTWYTKGWSECAFEGISLALPHDLHEWLEWPRLQLATQVNIMRYGKLDSTPSGSSGTPYGSISMPYETPQSAS